MTLPEALFDPVEVLDLEELDRLFPEGYYRWPESILTVRCSSCSFVWDFPFVVDIDRHAPFGLSSSPFTPGDELCPKCKHVGEHEMFPLVSGGNA